MRCARWYEYLDWLNKVPHMKCSPTNGFHVTRGHTQQIEECDSYRRFSGIESGANWPRAILYRKSIGPPVVHFDLDSISEVARFKKPQDMMGTEWKWLNWEWEFVRPFDTRSPRVVSAPLMIEVQGWTKSLTFSYHRAYTEIGLNPWFGEMCSCCSTNCSAWDFALTIFAYI